ncbi:Uncharacterized protein YjbI, contains pentapeptide repeats [Modestobacter sp. DSM 44400]|uniref:pentapeptide repeat-containing protein n=1 Tax=Modestobacter sp. DSM 44400 TaxID=1550230 RepID=UPI0008982486|nr:pentapeptide repeat-containing protein [Modestobacter sp. DSM 44400]SDY25940.1 Uncharacterized protein YjbI, contains pentapeptide repeats [Modestobacter sp. DSM 44400]
MADRKHGEAPPLTETEIRSQDWYAEDVSGQHHARVAFIDVDLTEVVDTGAVFDECTFRDCRFNLSTHTDAAFLNCTFTGCSFFDATFVDCKVAGSMFDRCTFGLFTVRGGDWSFVGLPGADLSRTSFTGVRMREADLAGTRCAEATWQFLDLSGAHLHSADLSGADLRGSDLSAVDPLNTRLAGAVIDGAQAVVLAGALGLDVRLDRG